MSTQTPNSSAKSRISRQQWLSFLFPFIIMGPVLLSFWAGRWDHANQTQRLEGLQGELNELQSRLEAVQRANDERQKQVRDKQPAPEKTKPAATQDKSGRLEQQKGS
jgi:hypothetical protein